MKKPTLDELQEMYMAKYEPKPFQKGVVVKYKDYHWEVVNIEAKENYITIQRVDFKGNCVVREIPSFAFNKLEVVQ